MMDMFDRYSSVIKFSDLPDPTDTWKLENLIGEGTYGEVYSGKHKVTGEVVAIKVIESIHEQIEEIEHEYQILRDMCNHPNMPRFHGLFLKRQETDSQIWIIMEMCSEGSITHLSKSLLDHHDRLDELLIAHVLKETLKVLHYLHKGHVMHRDVKGHNILITNEGDLKMIDFGVSCILKNSMARKNTSVGTPYWMAPEVIACERQIEYSYDIRCDLWSLGITAIEIAEGDPPLADLHPMRALFKIPRNPPPQFSEPDKWSQQFRDFVSKCLIKDFELRPFTGDLLNHPFIKQVPTDISEFKSRLKKLTAKIQQTVHEPDITTKKGRLKSHRKSKFKTMETVEDLAGLENLDEDSIVNQLFHRYNDGDIYTYIGDILLAVNPFRTMSLYGDEHSLRYMNSAKDDNPPHIFAVADQSYQTMMHNKRHQCIVISGESGAGKTESANLLVQQLTQLGKAANRVLEDQILQVNPLMEAFGNAKTVINDNSSRFGKYLEMIFTFNGTVIGAKITEYLLEKSRVISQAKGEQNFHIFYYVHDGLASEDKKNLYHLKDNTTYRYIEEYTSRTMDIAAISVNRVKFKAIQHCFEIIGFNPKEVESVYGIIAAILHTGNIEFTETEGQHGGEACVISNMYLVDLVSGLLGIPNVDLVEALTSTGMVARGELIVRENTVPEALDSRDAMSKALYGRLFSWIVNRINTLLKPQKMSEINQDSLIIGLLDIFGFENFPKNSFEQLCINIANEQIQYYFNQHIFAWEMQEYKNEGLEGIDVTFVDNRPLLDMFLMKPLGLLALLDEESHFPKATDLTLVDKFHKNIQVHYYSRPKGDNLKFCIDHYAGRVEYDATGFLEKNRDRLPADIVSMLRASDNEVVRALFRTPLTKTGNLASLNGSVVSSLQSTPSSSSLSSPTDAPGLISVTSYNKRNTASSMGGSRGSASTSMTRIQQTVSTYFRFSLMDLLAKMVAGTPHFVRCIRPNEEKLPDKFDGEKVKVQLRYTGVLETTRIRREGYSHRIPFADFIKRYSMLGFRWDEKITYTPVCCYHLLDRLKLDHWVLGKSKVFLKYYHIEILARKFEDHNKKVILIQSQVRMWLARMNYYKIKWKRDKSAVVIQKWLKGYVTRKKYKKVYKTRHSAAITVQRVVRGYLVKRQVKPLIEHRRKAAIAIQSAVRGHMFRRKMKSQKDRQEASAIIIQKAFRSYRACMIAKRLYEEKQHERFEHISEKELSALKIQTYYRMWRCKTVYQQLLKYKSQKELQLIYFSQQVEMYNKETLTALHRTNIPRKDPQSTQSLSYTVVPHSAQSSFYAEVSDLPNSSSEQHINKTVTFSLESQPDNYIYAEVTKPKTSEKSAVKKSPPTFTPPPPPVTPPPPPPPPPVPDVSAERLSQMNKMKEKKLLMPDKEALYYEKLNQAKLELQQTGPNSSTSDQSSVTMVTAEVHTPPLIPEHLQKRSLQKSVMNDANLGYYDKFAKTAQESHSRRRSCDLQSVPENQIIDWDKPLKDAQERSLSPRPSPTLMHKHPKDPENLEEADRERLARSIAETIVGTGENFSQLNMNGHSFIDNDPQAYTNEFYSEKNKFELVQRLEEECKESVVALWRKSLSQDDENFDILTSPDFTSTRQQNETNENENSLNNSKRGTELPEDVNNNGKSSKNTDNIAEAIDNSSTNLRANLRKTNINLYDGAKKETEIAQYDFRYILKKTGRLPLSEET